MSLYFRSRLRYTPDATWNATPVFIFTIFEQNLGIICSSTPTVPALFRRRRASRSTSTRRVPQSRPVRTTYVELSRPFPAVTLNTRLRPGLVRAQCSICANDFRRAEEARVAQAITREARVIRQAIPVDSFYLR
ncbi:MAG: hypothetical protein Q9191_006251 [Dirinaria sp. TL-2023a]